MVRQVGSDKSRTVWYYQYMRTPDHDRERSEKKRTLSAFVDLYNDNLPASFPRVSEALLKEFKKDHAGLFSVGKGWSLDQHRRKVMDWLRSRKVVEVAS